MHERLIKYSLFGNVTLNFKHVCQAGVSNTLVRLWGKKSRGLFKLGILNNSLFLDFGGRI